jgi:PAS domain S-box-containing protein
MSMPHQPLHILIVEDSRNDAELIVEHLRGANFTPTWQRVETEAEFLANLHSGLDLILSDNSLPNFSGKRALELTRESGHGIPFIFVSGTMGEEAAVQAIKNGAADYVMKDRIDGLGSAVAHALEEHRLRRGFIKAEQGVAEAERKFRTLFDAAHDPIYILHNGLFVDCNRKGEFMYGRTWNQIVGHSPDEFAPELQPDGTNSREKAFTIVQKALAGEPQSFDWCVFHNDGSLVYSEISLNRVEIDGKVCLFAISRDVTDRRQAEERISEQAALLEHARDAISVRDLTGKILFWNSGAERIYGWRRDEILGHDITRLTFPSPAIFEEANRLVVENGEWVGEFVNKGKDRRELTVEARWTLLRDKAGKPKSVLAIHSDVTEKKAFETQLMRAQRMESIGTLAGGIAHDLNNILTPILTSVEILKLRETDPQVKRTLETIEASSKRGADIVRQVLSFARGIKGERVEVYPKRLLQDIERLIGETFPKNIRLKLKLPSNCSAILGDPTRLHQILVNLCVNARDAMPQGGDLTLAVENFVLDEAAAAKRIGAIPGNYVLLSVADTGVGIPPEILDKIFEPFFTTKEVDKGTGLGLSTVLAIVKGHGGFIDVESEVGRGTVFKAFLPAMRASPQRRNTASVLAGWPRGEGEMILIVDDEAPIRQIASETLSSFGYRTLTARDGAEALEIYKDRSSDIAAVLTDMTMPIMDGPATIRALREVDPHAKIIASSGFKLYSDRDRRSEPGTKYFLAKPYSAEGLLTTVRAALDDAEAGEVVSES